MENRVKYATFLCSLSNGYHFYLEYVCQMPNNVEADSAYFWSAYENESEGGFTQCAHDGLTPQEAVDCLVDNLVDMQTLLNSFLEK